MRIAYDIQSTVGKKTGIGIYASQLFSAMRRIAPQHKFLDISWGSEKIMHFPRRLQWQQWEVPRRARIAHPDVLHMPGFDPPIWKPCPTVQTLHDLIGVLFPQILPPIGRFYWSRWLVYTSRYADALIVPSEHSKRDVIRIIGVNPDKVSVIPYGLNEIFRPVKDPESLSYAKAKYQLPDRFLLFVSTLEPRKGINTLIDAFASLANKIPHHIVLVGKPGWGWEPLFEQAKLSGISERIHFTNYIPNTELPYLYNLADALVFPSRYEGFGLPPLEAMACGTPVIASNASSIPEVVGDAALLISPDQTQELANAIEQIINNQELAVALRAKGIQRSKQFSWDRAAQETLDVYQRVLKKRYP